MSKCHYNRIKEWTLRRIIKSKLKAAQKKELEAALEEILTADPKRLLEISKQYNKLYPRVKATVPKAKAGKEVESGAVKMGKVEEKEKWIIDPRIANIFNYKAFRNEHGFQLAEDLGIACCPYCNRNYTTVHETSNYKGTDKKKVYPEFDHFYPQSQHPVLALSFFNLIPSCTVCNTHFKSFTDPERLGLFHPYTPVMQHSFRFQFYPGNYAALIGKGLAMDLGFTFSATPDVTCQLEKSIRFFDIKNTYERCHGDLIKEIIDKRIAYGNEYLWLLQKTFRLNVYDAYRILFEAHYEDQNVHKRPFSKLKRDIYEDLEIIRHVFHDRSPDWLK